MSQFITVATFMNVNDLAFARAIVEAQDIECHVEGENTVTAHPLFANAIGGIKLQVRKEDGERALAILVEGGIVKPSGDGPANDLGKAIYEAANRMGITNVSATRWWIGTAVVLVLIVALIAAM